MSFSIDSTEIKQTSLKPLFFCDRTPLVSSAAWVRQIAYPVYKKYRLVLNTNIARIVKKWNQEVDVRDVVFLVIDLMKQYFIL
jgi:hypothetical protein